MDAVDQKERTQHPQQQRTEGDHFSVGIEKTHQLGREKQHRQQQNRGGTDRKGKGNTYALSCPFRLTGTQILTDKGGDGQRDGLHGQQYQLIDLGIGGPAGHEIGTEVVDVGLDKHIGKGCDRQLQGGGDTYPEDLAQHIPVKLQLSDLQTNAVIVSNQRDDNQHSGNALGEDGCPGNTGDSHTEHHYEQKIQHRI